MKTTQTHSTIFGTPRETFSSRTCKETIYSHPIIMCVKYRGVIIFCNLSTVGGYHDAGGGYHEYHGRFHEYRGGVFSTVGYSNSKRLPPRY